MHLHYIHVCTCMYLKVHVPPGKDVEADVLEADTDSGERKRRQVYTDANTRSTYDENTKMNHFEAGGSFRLTRLREVKMARDKRDAVDHLNLPEAVESTLLAFINHSMQSAHLKFIYFLKE